MICVNHREAKAGLSQYARLIEAGRMAALCERNELFAEIRPLPPRELVPPAAARHGVVRLS